MRPDEREEWERRIRELSERLPPEAVSRLWAELAQLVWGLRAPHGAGLIHPRKYHPSGTALFMRNAYQPDAPRGKESSGREAMVK